MTNSKFSLGRTEATERMDATAKQADGLREAVRTVIDYLWHEEIQDYQWSPQQDRRHHIFETLVRLRSWLDGQAMSPDDFLEAWHR